MPDKLSETKQERSTTRINYPSGCKYTSNRISTDCAVSAESAHKFQPRATPWVNMTDYKTEPCKGSQSIPHVSLIVFNLVALEKCSKLVLKCLSPVMFLLPDDVALDICQMRLAY